MKTTKRSKMLVSSIAMLLVALVALGSATYAWYAINRQVTADQISITASTPGGLQISVESATTGWEADNHAELSAMTATLEPAALAFASNGSVTPTYYDGTDHSNGALTGAEKAAAAGAQYYVIDEIWLKNTNSVSGAITCTATASGTSLNTSYSCIALVDDAGTAVYTVKSAGTTTTTATGSGTASDTLVTLAKTDAAKHYYVVAWVDGYNTNCINDNAGVGAISWNLAFNMADVAA